MHFAELHRIVQTWILTFRDIGVLDAQLDEAKIALGEVRSLKKLSEMEWAEYWGAVQEVSDRNGGTYRLPGRPWRFSREELEPLGVPAFQGEHNGTVFSELGLSENEIDSYFPAQKAVLDDRATDLGARTRRQIAVGKV
jgi:crotonobetainyl-CoA:carnitine CoA-transferase CaiB-like acyl-CoA transferase